MIELSASPTFLQTLFSPLSLGVCLVAGVGFWLLLGGRKASDKVMTLVFAGLLATIVGVGFTAVRTSSVFWDSANANALKIEQSYGLEISDGQSEKITEFVNDSSSERLALSAVLSATDNQVFDTILIVRDGNSVTLFAADVNESSEFVELPLLDVDRK